MSAKTQIVSAIKSGIDDVFICNPQTLLEMCRNQIGPSACGATAVINALASLGYQVSAEDATRAVGTRLRNNNVDASLKEYLYSRHHAGATHHDIIQGISLLTKEAFPCSTVFVKYKRDHYNDPKEFIRLCAQWIIEGNALILTMNLQLLPVNDNERIHDAWHHQMVFGVSYNKSSLFMTNPLELMDVDYLTKVLDSDNNLQIHESDIFKRIQAGHNVNDIAEDLDAISSRWKELRVGDQLRRLYEERYHLHTVSEVAMTGHRYLCIPAAYSSGVLLVSRNDECSH
jgi:hypothetical protein